MEKKDEKKTKKNGEVKINLNNISQSKQDLKQNWTLMQKKVASSNQAWHISYQADLVDRQNETP